MSVCLLSSMYAKCHVTAKTTAIPAKIETKAHSNTPTGTDVSNNQ